MRCPVCRADNTETTCRRCKSDLTLAVAVEEQRKFALSQARQALRDNDWAGVVQHASTALSLRQGKDAAQLVCVGYFGLRDFARALQAYAVAKASQVA